MGLFSNTRFSFMLLLLLGLLFLEPFSLPYAGQLKKQLDSTSKARRQWRRSEGANALRETLGQDGVALQQLASPSARNDGEFRNHGQGEGSRCPTVPLAGLRSPRSYDNSTSFGAANQL